MPQLSLDLLGEKTTPDISICTPLTFDWQNDEIRLTVPPITTIEILSPKQALTDVTDKIFKNYFPAGVKSAWLIIPTLQTVHIILPKKSDIYVCKRGVYRPSKQYFYEGRGHFQIESTFSTAHC